MHRASKHIQVAMWTEEMGVRAPWRDTDAASAPQIREAHAGLGGQGETADAQDAPAPSVCNHQRCTKIVRSGAEVKAASNCVNVGDSNSRFVVHVSLCVLFYSAAAGVTSDALAGAPAG